MKADTYSLVTVFDPNARYLVPLFQRPYVWNLEDNWKPLWEDVRRVADEFLDGASVHPHFLGAIVLASVDPEFGQLPTWEVIDGQQRLTTLQVLFAAARGASESAGADQAAQLFSLFIANNEVLIPADHPEARWKVWPTKADQAQFESAMTTGDGMGPLVEARRWFEEQIKDWISDGEGSAVRSSALVTTLRERLRLVVIDLERDDDPQVIFETLNGRGTPLEAADLVKNLLFRTAARRVEHLDVLYAVWAPFDGEDWRKRVSVGRQFRSRLDVFLTHWLSMRTLREVTASTLYAGFSDWLASQRPEPAEVFAELQRFGGIYDSFDDFDSVSVEGRFFERLRAHQTLTVLPLLLHVWGRGDAVSAEQRGRILKAIDSFLMRRSVCGLTTKDYNNLFRDVLASVASEPDDRLDIAVVDALAAGTAESRFWPTDEQFRRSLETERLYRTMVRARLRTLLEAIEHELRTERSENLVGGTLTVEHILPRAWQDADWPLPEGVDAATRDEVLHSLGNLTLVTGRLNSTLSNRSWSHKKDWLGKHSLLRLTSGSVLSGPPDAPADQVGNWADDWNETRIATRARHLADIAIGLWPDPTALGGERPATPIPEAGRAPEVADDDPEANEDEAGSGRAPLYSRFWTEYLARLSERHPDWTRWATGPAQNWLPMATGIPGVLITSSFARRSRLRHELYIDRPTQAECKRLFDHLLAQRDRFEEAYGRPLEWERLDEGKASRIAEYATGRVATTSHHDEYMAFFEEAGERMRAALQAVDIDA